jgi:hypothetical protein
MQNSQPNPEIVSELYRALVLLGAKSDLLGTVGSWGDSLPEAEVLSSLRAWNAYAYDEIKARTEHYEVSSRPLDCSPVEARGMSLR